MKNRRIFLLLVVFIFSLSCQFLFPAREGTVISDCTDLVSAVSNIQPGEIPQHLFDTSTKRGDEFDANQYFDVLTHISMREGYALDYVYQNDSLGAFPILYTRPVDQAPYASMNDIPVNTLLPDFQEYINIEDMELGYFEYVVLDIMANQFYLFWHANYNDTQIVCNRQDVNEIVARVGSGDFGYKMDLVNQTKARVMRNIEPVVNLTGDVAIVQVTTFTKWGGFYRFTYTINRSFPHTIIDVKQENLVPYDCGIMF
ncbi:MAG TPA: hypothetical protein VJ821_16170 [Anaerolineales bacterium]|nr:hypothetical protein [Anaerolineales bacterium]